MIFKKIENTRKDYGFLFDYLLEKHFFRGYFNNESNFENCINAIKDYNLNFNNGNLIPLEELLLNDHFINTNNYNVLIQNLVDGLSFLPMHNLIWEIDNQLIADNFLYDHIFEHPDLPHYYVLHNNTPASSLCLINKITGKLFPYKMYEVLPSKFSNVINGRFNDEKFEENVHYSLAFETVETEKQFIKIVNENKIAIKDLISIPISEYAHCIHIDIWSSIKPEGTNILYKHVPLETSMDIEFRDKLIALLIKKNIEDLPF